MVLSFRPGSGTLAVLATLLMVTSVVGPAGTVVATETTEQSGWATPAAPASTVTEESPSVRATGSDGIERSHTEDGSNESRIRRDPSGPVNGLVGQNTTLSGVVTDADSGDPVSDALVVIASNQTSVRQRTGYEGTYRVSVPAGEYAMQVCAPGYLHNRTQIDVSGEYDRADRQLQPVFEQDTLDVEGTVQDVQVNTPVAGSKVTLTAKTVQFQTGPVNLSAGESIDADLRRQLANASDGTGPCASQASDYTAIATGETLTRSPGPDGNFVFRNLPPGKYEVTADAPTHNSKTVDLPRTPKGVVTDELLRSSRSLRFYLKGPTVNTSGAIMGWKPTDDGREKVPLGKFDVNASLVRIGERMLYGPLHDGYVAEGETGVETGETSTGFPLGRYEFESFPTGAGIFASEYRVSAWSAGYRRTWKNRSIAPGKPIDFVLDYVDSGLSLEVVSPAYENDAGEPLPVEGATVRLTGKPGDARGDNVPATEGVELTTQVDAEGRASFEEIPPGRYTVVVHQRTLRGDEARATFPRQEFTVHVKPNRTLERRVTVRPERGRLNGRLLTFDEPKFQAPIVAEKLPDYDVDLPNTSWGQFTLRPLADAQVAFNRSTFRGYVVNESVAPIRSGENGMYGRALVPANYELVASKDGFLPRTYYTSIVSDTEANPITQIAPARDYFYGVVIMGVDGMTSDSEIYNERGPAEVNPPGIHLVDSPVVPQGGGYGILRNATLTFESGNRSVTVQADDSGRFVLTEVPPGEYTVIVEHPDLRGGSVLPETLTSRGTGRLRSLVATAQPYSTVNTSLTVWNIPENDDSYIASRSYTLDGEGRVGKLRTRSIEADTGEPTQMVPVGRKFSMDVPDRRDGSRGFCRVGTTPDDTDVIFDDHPNAPDCGGTTTQIRAFAGHIYGFRSWKSLENATVELHKRTDSGGYELVGEMTTGPEGRYRITSPIDQDFPVGDHRIVVDHPTIDETTNSVFSAVPGTTRRDFYPFQKYQQVTVTLEDQDGNPVPEATVTFEGDGLQTKEIERTDTGTDGRASIGVQTPFEGRIQLSFRKEGFYPANATTAKLELTEPGNETDLGTVTSEALPAPGVTLTGITWASDDRAVGNNTHVLSGISDPNKPERTTVRLDVETDRLANLGDGPNFEGSKAIATVEAPYVARLSHSEWLRQRDPVKSLQLRLRQDADETTDVLTRQFLRRNEGDPGRWRLRVDFADLPPTWFVESEDFDSEKTTNHPITMRAAATTVKGADGDRESTLEEEEIVINRPPALYTWIYDITGGTTTEPPIPFGFDSVSTKGLKIPSRARPGFDLGTDQQIQRTPTNQLNYSISQQAMIEFAWFESADNLKELTTASKKWGIKAAGKTVSEVDIDDVDDTAKGSVSMSFSLPDKGPFTSDLLGGGVSGKLAVEVDNRYQLPPTPNLSTSIVQGKLDATGELDGTVKVDVGQAAATLFGGAVAQQIAKGLSKSGAAKVTGTVKGGPKATVGLNIDERLFPYDLQVESADDLELGGDFGVQLKGSLGMGAATSQANASVDANIRLVYDDGSLDPESGTLRGEAGSSVTLLGYTLWETAGRGIIVRQEFGTEGKVYVLERRESVGSDRGYSNRTSYATFRGEDGVLVANEYRFARPAVSATNGSAALIYAHDTGADRTPEAYELRLSRWAHSTDSATPSAPETLTDGGSIGGDVGVVDGQRVAAVSTVQDAASSGYPLAYLDQSEIEVRTETASGWDARRVTDNEFMEVQPVVADGLVAWTVDRDGLPWTLDDRQLRIATVGTDSVGPPQILTNGSVVGKAVDAGGDRAAAITVVLDSDGNPWTDSDRRLVRFTETEDGFESTTIAGPGAIASPAAASGLTAWTENATTFGAGDGPASGNTTASDVVYASTDNGTQTVATADRIDGVSADTLVGQPVVAWAERSNETTTFKAALSDENGWRGPIKLDTVAANVSDFEVAVDSETSRLVGTYTVGGEVNDTRTVRYLTADVSRLGIDSGGRKTVEVAVDAVPGNESNVVPADSGTVPVAILGAEDFDAAAVADDVESARLGTFQAVSEGGGVEPAPGSEFEVRDVDGDGRADLVIAFVAPDERTDMLRHVRLETNASVYVGSSQVRFAEPAPVTTPGPTTAPGPTTTDTQPTPGAGSGGSDGDDGLPVFVLLGALVLLAAGAFLFYRRRGGSGREPAGRGPDRAPPGGRHGDQPPAGRQSDQPPEGEQPKQSPGGEAGDDGDRGQREGQSNEETAGGGTAAAHDDSDQQDRPD